MLLILCSGFEIGPPFEVSAARQRFAELIEQREIKRAQYALKAFALVSHSICSFFFA